MDPKPSEIQDGIVCHCVCFLKRSLAGVVHFCNISLKKYVLHHRIFPCLILFFLCFRGLRIHNDINMTSEIIKKNTTSQALIASSVSPRLGHNITVYDSPVTSSAGSTSSSTQDLTALAVRKGTGPPRNLRLAFIGDSISRYMYLRLAHYLRWGYWETNETIPSIVVEKQHGSWNAFYNNSKLKLSPFEECDCWRNTTNSTNFTHMYENRYYWDPKKNNSLIYIQKLGNFSAKGHWDPLDVHWEHKLDYDFDPNFAWNYQKSWAHIIVHHLAKLPQKPQYLIFNAGLWPDHGLNSSDTIQSIIDALKENDIIGIYRTTTLKRGNRKDPPPSRQRSGSRRDDVKHEVKQGLVGTSVKNRIAPHSNKRQSPYADHDEHLCSTMQYCLDVSWIEHTPYNLYWDTMHFYSSVYTEMNLQLLSMLNITY
jgi:hypothetical protein